MLEVRASTGGDEAAITYADLLRATGATDAEQAFLALIDRVDGGAGDVVHHRTVRARQFVKQA